MKIKKVLVGIMAIATLTTCAFGAVGCKEKETEKETANIQNGGAVIMEGEGESNGISFMSTTIAEEDYGDYGISPTAESAHLLTATVTPSYATQAEVVWSVSFAGVDSNWSNGKTVTDYVTVSPAGSNSQTATVTCLKPFGDVIEVKAALKANSTKYATCDVHYPKRATGIKNVCFPDVDGAIIPLGGIVSTPVLPLSFDYEGINGTFNNYLASMSTQNIQMYETEAGTWDCEYELSVVMTLTDEFIVALEEAGFSFAYSGGQRFSVTYIGNWALSALTSASRSAFTQNLNGEKEAWATAVNALGNGKEIGSVHIYVAHESRDDRVPMSVEMTYDFEETYPIIINASSYAISASGISLSSTTVYM